jgi:hypothetical protein
LPQFLLNLLISIAPELKHKIKIAPAPSAPMGGVLTSYSPRGKKLDAVIATGGNASSFHFDYQFRELPRILRKNRSSMAILKGTENESELNGLCADIFRYYGLGCRNVSKIYIPNKYNFKTLKECICKYSYISGNDKYANNYLYNKALFIMNGINFIDLGFVLLNENKGISSPIGVIYYEYYQDLKKLVELTNNESENIQCVVAGKNYKGLTFKTVGFGETQSPGLTDYADGVDVSKFIQSIPFLNKRKVIPSGLSASG